MTLETNRRLGAYQVVGPIGAGGMGEVYRATDTTLGREVAIKVLPGDVAHDTERLARFEREARVLASLNHPNIASIYGFEQSYGVPFLVMELVEGDDLAERLSHGAMPVDEALPIARQIAEALEAAHDKGIVHRDLKPANVKVTPSGTVKVLDFGLAKALSPEGASATADAMNSPTLAHTGTQAGMILGTAAYMAPEQARGRPVDKRADIWAFGVLLWEMLTGRRLFVADTVSDVLAAVLTREPDWSLLNPHLSRPVRDLLRRCLVRNPAGRLHDIADARILIDEAIAGAPVEVTALDLSSHTKSRRREMVLFGALAAVSLLAAGLVWTIQGRATQTPAVSRNLSVVLPQNLRLVYDEHGSVAISPDGARIVVAAAEDRASRLYLRVLNSPELRPLSGTDGATGAFFSPDGHWIAFTRNGLRRLSIDGGEPVLLAPRSFGAGAWGQADEIYFTQDYNTGLYRVSAAGGTPAPLTRLDPARGELNHIYPEVLPGGRALLFTNHGATMTESRIEALSLAGGERHVVVEHAIEARYLHSGHLVFVRDETLMVAPFDLGTLRLIGPALPAPYRVAVSYGSFHADYALSANGTLALIPRDVLPARREVVRLDRAGRAETIIAAEKVYTGPALSPDGRQLAITRNEGGSDLLVYDLERRGTTRLADSPRREFGAVWDRSGARLFYAADLPQFQIFAIASSGSGEPTRLLEDKDDQLPQAVSPDGQWLLYLQSVGVNQRSLGILPLARPKQARLLSVAKGEQAFGCFSPDGRFVAFQSDESGRLEVYVRPVSEGAQSIPVSRAGGQQPRWAGNGDLFFWQGDQLFAVPVRTSPALQLGEPQPLFRTARDATAMFFEGDYAVSADGKAIYLARTPDLLRPRELHVVTDWASEVAVLFARGGAN